jgi:hypothetical protein
MAAILSEKIPSAKGKIWRLSYHFSSPSKGGEYSVKVAGAWGKVFVLEKLAVDTKACGAIGGIVCAVCEDVDPLSERLVSLHFLDFVGGVC